MKKKREGTTMSRDSCKCATCRSYCTHKPGWFKPGEAEKAAALLGLSLTDFFDKYLGVDYWLNASAGRGPTFLLSPAVVGNDTGTEFPFNPRGVCVFFKKGRCSIHEAKPFECKVAYHEDGDVSDKDRAVHQQVAESWGKYQGQIRKLLGREPKEADVDFSSMFSMFL